MTEIRIPFRIDFCKGMLDGQKTATTRTKQYGQPGDTFSIWGARFRILQVLNVPLGIIAKEYYKMEGFESPNEFIETWKKLHPRAGYDERQMVWLHIFERVKDG